MKIQLETFQPFEMFLFSLPDKNSSFIKILIENENEMKIFENYSLVGEKILDFNTLDTFGIEKTLDLNSTSKNFTISWKFKHIVIKFEGRKLPSLTCGFENQPKVNFFTIKSRLGDELINLNYKIKIIDFFSNLGLKNLS